MGADHDVLLGLARDVDLGADACDVGGVFVGLHHDFAAVGDLLLVVRKDFLPNDFRHEEAHGFVGQLVLGEEGLAFWQLLHDALEQGVHVEVVKRADGDHRGAGKFGGPGVELGFDGGLVCREINLVDQHKRRHVHRRNLLQGLRVRHALLVHVGHDEKHVGVLQRRLDKLHHALLQLVGGVEHARGVAVDDLAVVLVDDAHDAVARGLGLGVDDAQTLPHQPVHQGALADVGRAHDVHEARTVAFRHRMCGAGVGHGREGCVVRHGGHFTRPKGTGPPGKARGNRPGRLQMEKPCVHLRSVAPEVMTQAQTQRNLIAGWSSW